MDKTNVARIFDAKKIEYKYYVFSCPPNANGIDVAAIVGKDPKCVFKTLVTTGKTLKNYVFVIPVAEELDLKKAAASVGEKSVEMLKQKDLLPTTGYVHGGCSPVGMKKFFKTVIDASADTLPTITYSAGRIGFQVETTLAELAKSIRFSTADLIKNART